MILNLNGSFLFPSIHRRRLLIELYSGDLPVSLTLVRPYLQQEGIC
jgi:hypothetical protein